MIQINCNTKRTPPAKIVLFPQVTKTTTGDPTMTLNKRLLLMTVAGYQPIVFTIQW